MEISKIKLEFLKRLGIDIENLPNEFAKVNHPYELIFTREERRFIESNDYTSSFIMPFSMKDICGTSHPNYGNMIFLESFSKLKRGDENIKQFYYNPSYYSEKLRQQNQSSANTGHDTPLELYRLSDGRCIVNGGNNRINIMMMLYLSELSKAKTDEEKEQVNKKYTFYAEIRSLPKNKDVCNAIFLLKDKFGDKIKFEFIGNNPDDCHYNVNLNGGLIEIKNVHELKQLLINIYDIKTCFNPSELYENIFSLVFDYTNALINAKEGKLKLLREICPEIEKIKEQFFLLRKLTLSKHVFDGMDVSSINYSNLSFILQEVINKIQKQIEQARLNDIKEGFNNCKNKNDIISLIHKTEMLSQSLKEELESLLPNYSYFVDYFNEVEMMLPEEFSDEWVGSYSKIYAAVLEVLISSRKDKLKSSKQQEQALRESSLQYQKQLVLILNQDVYEEVKLKNNETKMVIEHKKTSLNHIKQNKKSNESKRKKLKFKQQELLKRNFIVRLFLRQKITNIRLQLQHIDEKISRIDQNIELINSEMQSLEELLQSNEAVLSQNCGFEIGLQEYENELTACQEQSLTEGVLKERISNIENSVLNLNITGQENQLKQICNQNGISLSFKDNEFGSDTRLKI